MRACVQVFRGGVFHERRWLRAAAISVGAENGACSRYVTRLHSDRACSAGTDAAARLAYTKTHLLEHLPKLPAIGVHSGASSDFDGSPFRQRHRCYGRQAVALLPPTSEDLRDDDTRPYFLWWTDATVGDLRAHLRAPDSRGRAYWMGALLREANTRDVWLYVTPDEIRDLWPELIRHLGRSRSMWAFLLGLAEPQWPPPEARRG